MKFQDAKLRKGRDQTANGEPTSKKETTNKALKGRNKSV